MLDRVIRGDHAQVRCSTKLDDGSWVGDTESRDTPLWIKAGQMHGSLQAITDAVVGMKIGEHKSLCIGPRQAFGASDETKILSVPLKSLPRDIKVGDWASVTQSNFRGDVVVLRMDDDDALVDGNHPLAGHTLHVELQVLAIERKR